MNVLGLSFMYHDSSACLLMDGQVVAASEEERFSRQKHSLDFPEQAIAACLKIGGITSADLDAVVFYEKPLLKFERILTMNVEAFPRGFRLFSESIPLWLKYKLFIRQMIRENLNFKGRIAFIDHHYAHAASSFFSSGFEEAALLTMDGVGEWATMTRGVGRGTRLNLTDELRYPHSLGLLYSTVTAFLGFKVNGGEGKVMGLASYGEPVYADWMLKELIDIRDDGSFRFNLDYFDFFRDMVMYSPRFVAKFGKPRVPESEITQRDKDVAASLQLAMETIALNAARTLQKETGLKKICIAGGCGLNSVANGRILAELPFDDIFIQPASGDDGGSLGSALGFYHHVLGKPRVWRMENAFLGPANDPTEVERFMALRKIPHRIVVDRNELIERAASALTAGKIVGWCQGRMEFGPRALGNRSILANPTLPDMKDVLNARVKHREWFRPFAPAVLEEKVGDYFDPPFRSPYMLLVSNTRKDRVDLLPSVTHVDGTARLQTVSRDGNPLFYSLIERFGEKTGVPVVLNTSFNIRGEPIICDYGDALACFLNTDIDALALENCWVEKDSARQPIQPPADY